MKRALATVAALLAPVAARADAPPEATALFEQGIKDMQGGNLEAGCKELAASLARYTDSGTKGALATCYTRQGKVTSAWNLWKDLADTAPQADDKADAAKNAAALEPRLPHFLLKLGAAAPDGLVITVNGSPADPSLGVPLPVDPGPVIATARAPDHKDWAQTYMASEAKLVTIEVPALAELPKAPPVIAPPPPQPQTATPVSALRTGPIILREDNSGTRHSRHVIGGSLAVIGVAGAVVGAVYGNKAKSQWNDAQNTCTFAGGSITNCSPTVSSAAESDVNTARTSALVSTIAFGAGGAVFLTGAIIFLSAPSDVERSTSALRVTPAVGASSYGLVFTGRW